MNNHLYRRLGSLLLLFSLAVTLCPPIYAQEDPSILHIQSREDWNAFADHCRLDTWSQNKVVILDQDLDLTGSPSVPTFGGTFEGGGHTLRGFRLDQEGDHAGLFRYIQEGGTVRHLNLSAQILPSGTSGTVGGLAAVNSGTLEFCSFQGAVSGVSAVGGLAGYNGPTGQILSCVSRSGSISGHHSTGGTAGVNYGLILNCTNSAAINTQEADLSGQIGSVNWTDLNSTENVPACTDTGGIAGYSKGVISGCINRSSVGYAHTGYNVGGIAGRQAGYLENCANHGTILGRKEVGGIVGQMEPFTLLRYEEDTLQKLSRELDVLGTLMEDALDATDVTRVQLSGHITNLTGQTGTAQDQIFSLLDDIEQLGDGTVDSVNELSRRINRVLDQLVPVSDQMASASDRLNQSVDQLDQVLSGAQLAGQDASQALAQFRTALSELDQARRTLLTAVPVPLDDPVDENAPESNTKKLLQAIEHTLNLLTAMSDELPRAQAHLDTAYEALSASVGALEQAGHHLSWSEGELRTAMEQLSDGTAYMTQAITGLRDSIQEQSELPDLQFPKLDPEFHQKEDALSQTLTAMTDELEQMNQTANQGGDQLSQSLKRINDQFSVLSGVLKGGRDSLESDQDRVVDISAEALSSETQGKVTSCRNFGAVDGDVNIGGLAGSLAIEYDFDPEDDISDQGNQSMNFKFLTRVILQDCVNRGPVTARKDCAGGAAGRLELGIAVHCENYAPVTSTGGECVGGIAGLSRGILQDCWAKCPLEGTRRVGGIAGYAADLRRCHSLVQINGGTSYVGAIAGEVQREGSLTANNFVSDVLGGADGISYSGKAEPLAYEDFMDQDQVPADFRHLVLSFTADGRTIYSAFVPYRGAVRDNQIPPVPRREGWYGRWSDFDRNHLAFDTTVEALYSPLLPTLVSEDGTVLAEGSFTPEDSLTVRPASLTGPECSAQVRGPFTVSASSPMTALRAAVPSDWKDGELLVLQPDGSWAAAEATREGSFLRIAAGSDSVTFCLAERVPFFHLWMLLPAGILVLAAALLAKKKLKRPAAAPQSDPEDS